MDKKILIVLSNVANQGKTQSVIKFANLLLNSDTTPIHYDDNAGNNFKYPVDKEFGIVVDINGKIVGIHSAGDYKKEISKEFDIFKKENCEIIICTSRYEGETVDAIEKFADDNDFEIIWTYTNTSYNDAMHEKLNECTAQNLLSIFNSIVKL